MTPLVLAMGLSGVNALRCGGEDLAGVENAVDFIASVRQEDRATIPVGRNVVVIGGGMTAIDAAVQAKLLGAETVTIAYRRSREEMPASRFEQDLATAKGVLIRENLQPKRIIGAEERGDDRARLYPNRQGRLGDRPARPSPWRRIRSSRRSARPSTSAWI